MRRSFKKTAESNSNDFEKHLGDLLDKTWEVIRVSSSVIDKCLQVESTSTTDNAKQIRLLMMSRNLLSDCCCSLDALERGHERTIFNNLRMILEDLCCIIEASENEKVYAALQKGEHQASKSISFAVKQHPTQGIGDSYGMLSKVSHHMDSDLIVRQWINRDGLLSHIKPFNPNRYQAQLNILLSVTHFSRLVGEVAEKLCVEKLEVPYFWTKQKNRNPSPPINAVVSEIADKIREKWDFLDSLMV
ncbi:MAG: hypothetical protein WDZ28_03275 [Simkaniaceae bacterium]